MRYHNAYLLVIVILSSIITIILRFSDIIEDKYLVTTMLINISLVFYYVVQALSNIYSIMNKYKENFKEITNIHKIIAQHNEIFKLTQKDYEIEILDTKEFYRKLSQSVSDASTIKLMSMQHTAPKVLGVEEVENYFKTISSLISNKKEKSFKRIISIKTKEKFSWVISLIKQHKNDKNFILKYIDVNPLYKENKNIIPYPLNIQIINKEEVFIINPQKGFMIYDSGIENENIWIKSKKAAKILSVYYDSYFDMCTTIFKDGKIYMEELEKIMKDLKIEQSLEKLLH